MAAGDPRKSRFLGFFGLESREKALQTLLWVSPYLAFLVAALGGLSYLVHQLMPLQGWVYALAILLALIYFFFFLARVRQMGTEASARGEEPPNASH